MVRGDIFRLTSSRDARGHEERGAGFAIVVQADEFLDLRTTCSSYFDQSATGKLPPNDHGWPAGDPGPSRADDRRRPATAAMFGGTT
jgi:hypothetical protein